MNKPLVSIIVRTLGCCELHEALDSIALQTYPKIEVLVIDSQGEDQLKLDDFCGRFPLTILTENIPLRRSRAANLGLDNANGDYILFLDEDDFLFPSHISSLMEKLINNPKVRAVYSDVDCRRIENGIEEIIHTFNEDYNSVRLLYENFLPIHAVLFHNSLITEDCMFDDNLDIYEDWDFWVQVSQKTKFIRKPGVTAVYRISDTSGFGTKQHDPKIELALSKFLQKWQTLWTMEELLSIREHAKTHNKLQSVQRELVQLQQELALSGIK